MAGLVELPQRDDGHFQRTGGKMLVRNCGGCAFRIVVESIALALLLAGGAGAATLTVDDSGGADYTSIQDAIDNASAGDTILVYSGMYYENVNVSKQLVLRGQDNGGGAPVVDAGGIGDTVKITADGVMLEGFNARNSVSSAGIYVISNNNIIRNNNVSNNSDGIYLFSTSNNVLSGNTASSNNRSGILLLNSSYSRVENNIASNNKGFEGDMWHGQPPSTGIEILGSHNIIINNEASNNFVGIGISIRGHDSDMILVNNTVEGNIIRNNTGISDVQRSGTPSSGILVGSDNNVLRNNTILDTGIFLWSNNNKISNNTVLSNSGSGIYLAMSSNNTLTDNKMIGNYFGLSGVNDSHLDNNIDTSNLVNGKPIYYIKGAANTVYDFSTNAGTFYCIKCLNVTIKDMDLKSSEVGVLFWKTTGSRIQNVSVTNTYVGIVLLNSSNNTIHNNIASNNSYGIHLGNRSSYNEISENNVYSNNKGIALTVFELTQIASNQYNTIINNTIFSNRISGIELWLSDNNKVYHNNIQNNSIQAFDNGTANSWDNGYTSGGNYWSDYSGINANNDSIGDTPYNISGGAEAQDRYPFMRPNGWLLQGGGTLSPVVAPFDTNSDNRIDRGEAVAAVVRFFSGDSQVPRTTAVAVVVAFFSPPA